MGQIVSTLRAFFQPLWRSPPSTPQPAVVPSMSVDPVYPGDDASMVNPVAHVSSRAPRALFISLSRASNVTARSPLNLQKLSNYF